MLSWLQGMCEPGQGVYECLKAEFTEEALGNLIDDEKKQEDIRKKLKFMFESGSEVITETYGSSWLRAEKNSIKT